MMHGYVSILDILIIYRDTNKLRSWNPLMFKDLILRILFEKLF